MGCGNELVRGQGEWRWYARWGVSTRVGGGCKLDLCFDHSLLLICSSWSCTWFLVLIKNPVMEGINCMLYNIFILKMKLVWEITSMEVLTAFRQTRVVVNEWLTRIYLCFTMNVVKRPQLNLSNILGYYLKIYLDTL